MLTFEQQLNINVGITKTFLYRYKKRSLHHGFKSRKIIDKYHAYFPTNKFKDFTKENFVLTNLFLNFNYSPSSIGSGIKDLSRVKQEDVLEFKRIIFNYKKYIKEDLIYLENNFGNNFTLDLLFNEYIKKKIKFYTLYFWIDFNLNDEEKEKLRNTRIKGNLYEDIESLMLFLTFNKKSVQDIKNIMNNEKLDINE